MEKKELLRKFYAGLDQIYTLTCIHAGLEWDQQVYMPPKAAGTRGKQLELIETLRHAKVTSPEYIKITNDLFEQIDSLEYADRVNVRETHRHLERQQKLPSEFVGRKALACSEAFDKWTRARPAGDYGYVSSSLKTVIDLNKEEADLIGYEGSPYNALLDSYEPYAKLEVIKPILLRLSEALSRMLPTIEPLFERVEEIDGDFPEETQAELCKWAMQALGFDFEGGRLDKSQHPFCSTLGTGDQRITTRYSCTNFLSALYGTVHETGHALYEMGLLERFHGTPMGFAASLGVHESQSRFFENMIGRSRQFCVFLHGHLREFFPDFHHKSSPEMLWKMLNKVKPTFIRVEADEITYSLHVVIRMLLEEQLLTGSLAVSELPEAWNSLYAEYLGIQPKNVREGVLQDVHWYSGLIGYFPTYALGNLYGALMLTGLKRDLPDYLSDVENGIFERIVQWFRKNVHEKGMQFTGPELVEQISALPFNEEPFLEYLKEKFAPSSPRGE